jgi:dienelactone hydrolase
MSTEILDSRALPQLQPAFNLLKLYQPEAAPYRFKANSIDEAQIWQAEVRHNLNDAVGFQLLPTGSSEPLVIENTDRGDHTRQKILLYTSENTLMPVYLLLPKEKKPPFPVIIAFHGHGYGVKDIIGLWEDGQERNTPDGYQKDFAVELCRRGFAVASPEISCFGERRTDFSNLNTTIGSPIPDTCDHTARLAFHLGGSVVGLRVLDGKRLVDYLETRPDLDISRLGAMGISGGGMHTFFSTCLDPRIKACVISGYFSTFRDSILAMHHCVCNFVPGLGKFGEMYDLVGLIAPRPLFVESGTYDPIFPINAVQESIKKTRLIYELFGAIDQLGTDFFEGRHQINGRVAYDFLTSKLD